MLYAFVFSFSQIFKELTLTIVLFPFPSILPSCFIPSQFLLIPSFLIPFLFFRYVTRHSFSSFFTSARQGGGIVSRFRYPRDILTANGAIIIHQIGSGPFLKPRQIGQRKYLISPAIFIWLTILRFTNSRFVSVSSERLLVWGSAHPFRLFFSLSNK